MSLPQEKRPTSRPTLEDLLQLKRSERPPAEFWETFNRGLREKQLAALVHQPRGFARFKPLFTRAIRWTVPVGAAAVATFGVVRHLALSPAAQFAQSTQQPIFATATPDSNVAESAPAVVSASTSTDVVARDPLAEIPNVRMLPATVLADAREGVSVREINSPAQTKSDSPRQSSTPLVVVAHAAADALHQPVEFVQDRFSATADLGQQIARTLTAREGGAGSGWGDVDSRLLEVSALDLRVSHEHAGNLMSTPVSYSAQPKQQLRDLNDDREYRELGSRFGVQGSSLTIRF